MNTLGTVGIRATREFEPDGRLWGGMTLAADLTLTGHSVFLHQLPQCATGVEPTHAIHGITVNGPPPRESLPGNPGRRASVASRPVVW